MARSGDRCDQCGAGRWRVYCTRTIGLSRIRFLRCSNCGTTDRESCGVDDLGRSILRVGTKPSIGETSQNDLIGNNWAGANINHTEEKP